ncbi:MAG: cell division ATP-binding protein FtsE, partial [Massilia sp.]|nr:cell division ATP-binding protein FtsE [Massilia sp.]
ELVYLAGPSGAGKSTLMKMVAAIERPSSGRVIVFGQDIGKLKKPSIPFLRRKLGLIFQHQRLLNDRNILANVMLPLLVSGAPNGQAEGRARAALDKVGLLDRVRALPLELSGGEQQRVAIARAIVNRPQVILADEPTANLDRAKDLPLELSGGEQQRVAIARAIVNRPQIILADEPTANLDRVAADKVLDALRAFNSVGVTCVISTHDEQVLDRAARVIRLEHGQLVSADRVRADRRASDHGAADPVAADPAAADPAGGAA